MPTVSEVQGKIQRMLQKLFGSVEIDSDGDFVFKVDSTVAFGRVADWGDGDVIFNVYAPVLLDVPITNELCRYVATESFVLGNLILQEASDGRTGELQYHYRIVANDVDESEVRFAVLAVALTADELDGQLVRRFGGRVTISG